MKPRVATVLSARDWEPNLVAAAQTTAGIRLVGRIYQPDEVTSLGVDVVVVGAETSWLSAARIRTWTRAGIRIVGVYPDGDRPARKMLQDAGVDEALPDSTETASLIRHIRSVPTARKTVGSSIGQLVVVGGARGAPGRTEISVALASQWSADQKLLLLDLDQESPAIAIRLGLAPRPDLIDLVDHVRTAGEHDPKMALESGSFRVAVGSHRPDQSAIPDNYIDELIDAVLAKYDVVVADMAPGIAHSEATFKRADHAVLVSDASVVGLVRTARMIAEWAGPPPALVINHAGGQNSELIRAARQWTGLEPAAVIKHNGKVLASSRRGSPPERGLLRAVSSLKVPA